MLDIIKLVTLKSLFIVLLVAGAANSSNAFGAALDFLPVYGAKKTVVTKTYTREQLTALINSDKLVCITLGNSNAEKSISKGMAKRGISKRACTISRSANGKRMKAERMYGPILVLVLSNIKMGELRK